MRRGSFALLLLAATGCREATTGDGRADTPAPVRLALLPPSREGDSAVAQGVLAVDGPCLYLVGADGGRTMPAFITYDTSWEGGRLQVGDAVFAVGQEVQLGGGEANGNAASLPWVQAPHPECDVSRLWITVSVEAAED